MTAVHRWSLKAARLVHLFISMVGMLLVLFFAITGFLLNHEGNWDWLKFDNNAKDLEGPPLPGDLLRETREASRKKLEADRKNILEENETPPPADPVVTVAELKIADFLRHAYGIQGEFNYEFSESGVRVQFKAPGRSGIANIAWSEEDTSKCDLSVSLTSHGLLGKLLDMHRGQSKGTGWIWSLVLDATCFLLVFLALTGLIIWSSLKTRRLLGLIALTGGVAATLAVYLFWVP